MNLNVWLKRTLVNKFLYPVRKQVCELLPYNSHIVDIGCGCGDLLFESSGKIKHGLGIDTNRSFIDYANYRVKSESVSNLIFKKFDALDFNCINYQKFDVSICMLCLHEMGLVNSIALLDILYKCSEKIILVDYIKPTSKRYRIIMEIDELLSIHYHNYRCYLNYGGIPRLSKILSNFDIISVATKRESIGIWITTKHQKTKER